MKKLQIFLLALMISISIAGTALADEPRIIIGDYIPTYHMVTPGLDISNLELAPGQSCVINMGGWNFGYSGPTHTVDNAYNWYYEAYIKDTTTHTDDISFVPEVEPFYPSKKGVSPDDAWYDSTNNIRVTLSGDAIPGTKYEIRIGGYHPSPNSPTTHLDFTVGAIDGTAIPEYPSIAAPVGALLGLIYIIGRKKDVI